jgi:hypothetical protein
LAEFAVHKFEAWRESFQRATTAESLVGLVDKFVRSIPADDMARLPEECREALRDAAMDLSGGAVTLLQAELRAPTSPTRLAVLQELSHTLIAASNRLRQIEMVNSRAAGEASIPKRTRG